MCEIQRSSNSKAMTTINVTQEDIERGKRESACECPIALALERAFNAKSWVDDEGFFFQRCPKEKLSPDYPIPQSAIAFIAAFDAGEKVEPFEFEVEV